MVQYNIGSLSRITFHYPPTFTERDVVLIISRSVNFIQEFLFFTREKCVKVYENEKRPGSLQIQTG